MTNKLRRRPRIGDVIEVPTRAGFGYAQYTHEHREPPTYGALLRVLPGTFPTRPTNLQSLVQQPEAFLCFFPLGAACRRDLIQITGNEPIPSWAQPFPVFRTGVAGPSGRVYQWFLWDGKSETSIAELTPELAALPVLTGVWNHTLLAERIATAWRPGLA